MSFKKEILDNIKSLPPMDTTTRKMMTLLSNKDVEISEVVKLIQYDPALTSNVLKLVNSAYFNLQSKITSIKHAVIMLGINQIYRITIAVSFSSLLNKPLAGYELSSGALWRHSVATAIATEMISKMLKQIEIDILFTAALLHDIGKIALSTFVDKYFDLIEKESEHSGKSFEVIENMVLGIDHAEAGAIILKNWGIPMSLYLPVRWHHNPDECNKKSFLDMVDIVHIADSLCITGGIGVGKDGLQYQISSKALSRHNFDSVTFETIMNKTIIGLDSIKEIFII